MRLILIICVLLLFESCIGQQKDQKNDLTDLRNKLPLIKTPFGVPQYLVKCESVVLPDNNIISSLRKKFEQRHVTFVLFGKVFESENYLALIGLATSAMGTPIIIVFNSMGDQIDSLAVYPEHHRTIIDSKGLKETFNFAYIYPDKQIISLDSTVYMDVKMIDGKPKELPETQTFSTKTKKFKISDKGKFEQVD